MKKEGTLVVKKPAGHTTNHENNELRQRNPSPVLDKTAIHNGQEMMQVPSPSQGATSNTTIATVTIESSQVDDDVEGGCCSKELANYSKIQPVAWMIIFGDSIHNFVDGLSIGAGMARSFTDGLSIAVRIFCFENSTFVLIY